MPLTTGQILQDRYRIVELIGEGGFGAVYRSWDMRLNSPCALKENLDGSPEAQRQFAREASILAGLRHPNLPRVIDYFSVPGQGQYLVMDFVEGETLENKMQRNGTIPEAQAIDWISQICDALAYLHNQNPPIIHRDVKPGNITITPNGQAMLIDFGAFKAYAPHLKTTMAARVVSPGYAPVEQYGTAATDARTDVYAVGATLYAILGGTEPPESIARLTGTPVPDLGDLNPDLSLSLIPVIEHAMGVMPDQRTSTITDLQASLHTKGSVKKSGSEKKSLKPLPTSLPEVGTEQNEQLDQLYEQIRNAYLQNDWQNVRDICLEIEAIQPENSDTSDMLAHANEKIESQKALPTENNSILQPSADYTTYQRDGIIFALVSILGWATPALSDFVLGSLGSYVYYFYVYVPSRNLLLVSVFVGCLQWLVVRKYIQYRSWYWILSWFSAYLLSIGLIYIDYETMGLLHNLGAIVGPILYGLVLGITQWYILRHKLSYWWILLNVLGIGALFAALNFAWDNHFEATYWVYLVVGGIFSVVTAVILFHTLSKEQA